MDYVPHKLQISPIDPAQQTLPKFQSQALFRLSLVNQGRQSAQVQLIGDDPEHQCRFEFILPDEPVRLSGPVVLYLAPQQTLSVLIWVIPPVKPWMALLKSNYHFTIIAQNLSSPQKQTQAVLGQVLTKPVFGPGSMAALLLICLFGFLAGGDKFIFSANTLPQHLSGGLSVAYFQKITQPLKPQIQPLTFRATPTVPSVAVNPSVTYEELFKQVALEYDLDWRILAAQAYYESRMNPTAIGRDMELGLMQILPSTWARWSAKVGVTDPFDPYSNVRVGAAYHAYLQNLLAPKVGYSGPEWIIVAYNWGPHNVLSLIKRDAGWADVPVKTRAYAINVVQDISQPTLPYPQLQQIVPDEVVLIP